MRPRRYPYNGKKKEPIVLAIDPMEVAGAISFTNKDVKEELQGLTISRR